MANELSTAAANLALDWLTGTGNPTRPTTLYLALGTGTSSTALSGEPSGNGYARQAVTWAAAASRATSNTVALTFGPCTTSDWGTLSHAALFTASSGGTYIGGGSLDSAKLVAVGDSLVVDAGALDFTVGAYSD